MPAPVAHSDPGASDRFSAFRNRFATLDPRMDHRSASYVSAAAQSSDHLASILERHRSKSPALVRPTSSSDEHTSPIGVATARSRELARKLQDRRRLKQQQHQMRLQQMSSSSAFVGTTTTRNSKPPPPRPVTPDRSAEIRQIGGRASIETPRPAKVPDLRQRLWTESETLKLENKQLPDRSFQAEFEIRQANKPFDHRFYQAAAQHQQQPNNTVLEYWRTTAAHHHDTTETSDEKKTESKTELTPNETMTTTTKSIKTKSTSKSSTDRSTRVIVDTVAQVQSLISQIEGVNRDDPQAALAQIDAILRAQSGEDPPLQHHDEEDSTAVSSITNPTYLVEFDRPVKPTVLKARAPQAQYPLPAALQQQQRKHQRTLSRKLQEQQPSLEDKIKRWDELSNGLLPEEMLSTGTTTDLGSIITKDPPIETHETSMEDGKGVETLRRPRVSAAVERRRHYRQSREAQMNSMLSPPKDDDDDDEEEDDEVELEVAARGTSNQAVGATRGSNLDNEYSEPIVMNLNQDDTQELADAFDSAWVSVPASQFFPSSNKYTTTVRRPTPPRQYQQPQPEEPQYAQRQQQQHYQRPLSLPESDVVEPGVVEVEYIPVDEPPRLTPRRVQKTKPTRLEERIARSTTHHPTETASRSSSTKRGLRGFLARRPATAGTTVHTEQQRRRRSSRSPSRSRARSLEEIRNPNIAKKFSRILRVYDREPGHI